MINRLPVRHRLRMLIVSTAIFATPLTALAAQDDAAGWQFVVAPYLLSPHMNGNVAVRSIPAEVEIGPSDIFDNLDFGAMLYLEATNPEWAITLDGIYMDLGAEGMLPLSGRTATVGMKQWTLEATGIRRLANWAEAGIGARVNSIETGLGVPPEWFFPGSTRTTSIPGSTRSSRPGSPSRSRIGGDSESRAT